MRRQHTFLVALFICVPLLGVGVIAQQSGFERFWGDLYEFVPPPPSRAPLRRPPVSPNAADHLRFWNQVAIDASGLDHTPVQPGEDRVFGEQLGPARAARAMAIVHIATFDAVVSITRSYPTYTGVRTAPGMASVPAAIAQAAHDTLVSLFPSQRALIDNELAADLAAIAAAVGKSAEMNQGVAAGQRAAAAILRQRVGDGWTATDPIVGVDYIPEEGPGFWRQDPISQLPIALGADAGNVTPFALRSGNQFRLPAPPALTSPQYAAAYNEVKALGGDGITTPTQRTPEQTFIGVFWAYDGTPSLCAPPRLYNQVALAVAETQGTVTDVVELARLLALINVALADASIASWESKYFYELWRPIGGIREGETDGNAATIGDPTFTPLGAPASNLVGPNFTPPFPAYPSGHATLGGALFQTLRRYYATDNIPFTFISDEFNGETRDNTGVVRPLIPRSYSTLSEAEEENGQSRIYLGIHWAFDKTAGIAQGRQIANYAFDRVFR